MPNQAPLELRVLNASRGVAGAYATRLLADLGADCCWWDWAPYDRSKWPPDRLFREWFEDRVDVVPQAGEAGDVIETMMRLAGEFDLVITDFAAEEAGGIGIGEAARLFNPGLVVANVTHFGTHGPYASWVGDELTDYAMGGYWAIAGDPGAEPLRVPGYQAQFHAGMQLALAAIAACRFARITGDGQDIEVNGVEAMLGAHWSTTIAWTHEGRILKRAGCDLFPAKDGWVFFFQMGLNKDLFVLIERPDLLDDPRFDTIAGWRAHGPELWGLVAAWCTNRTVDEIVNGAQDLRIPATPMTAASTLIEDPALVERHYFRQIQGAPLPGRPYRWSGGWDDQPAQARLKNLLAAPPRAVRIGRVSNVAAEPSRAPGVALAGIRVLELTNNWAGPIAGRHLADLGAEVIKIELATKPATRGSHYPGSEPGKYHWNRSGYFNEMNRNKRGLSLNLASKAGREAFLRLVAKADVVIENNSARVMPNLGLSYERLREVNPRLIMASISGFGATGPKRDWVAYGSNIETASGLASVTGYPGGLPQRTSSFVADPIAGGHAAIGVLAALERRDRTGEGAYLDIALTESALPFMLLAFTHLATTGTDYPRQGNVDAWDAPTGAYRCAGTDDWVAIAVRTESQWEALAELAALPAEMGRSPESRTANRAAIDERLRAWTVRLTQYECANALQRAGVPAAPILHNWQLHMDPHLFARNAFVPIEHPDMGVLPYPGAPWELSLTPARIRTAAPRFAEGNDYVFRRLLGLSDAEVTAMYESGATTAAPSEMPAPG